MNCAILIYGGILTSICMWSTHASASIISTPFCSHSFRNISPISFFNVPYISFLRYFGANTIWYWHLYFEWAVLLISLFPSFFNIISSLYFSNAVAKPLLLYLEVIIFAPLFCVVRFSLLKRSFSPGRTGGFHQLPDNKNRQTSNEICRFLVGHQGLEPRTNRLWAGCSDQLS